VVTKNKDGTVTVTGNSCPRGAEYGKQEMLCPQRIITTIKKTATGTISVKTSTSVNKGIYFDVLQAIKDVPLKKSYKFGEVLIKNVCNSGADIVITGVHKP